MKKHLPETLLAALLATLPALFSARADDAGASPDAGAPELVAAVDAEPAPDPTAAPAMAPPPPSPAAEAPAQLHEVTVVGTRERQTAGSAHIVREKTLERFELDNPESVLKSVPGVYARGEDGFGLRPNLGLRGASPERSRKVTLMEDGILFGPAPYSAPAAYYFPLVTRMISVRVIKGPGAVVYGPQTVGGAVDFVTRRIPQKEGGGIDAAVGQYAYGKLHGHYGWNSRTQGFLVEGLHLRTDGFKQLDGGGDTGFERNEWMVKARRTIGDRQELSFKGGYSSEDSRETYLGLSDDDFAKNPLRRYTSSRLDRMRWHRTSLVLRHVLDFGPGHTLETSAYRHDFDRTWRKVNRFGDKRIDQVLADPTGLNAIYAGVLRGQENSTRPGEAIFIGPNARGFVSQGLQSVATLRLRGAIEHRIEAGARLHYDRIERHHSEDGFLMRDGNLVPDGRETVVNADERVWALALAAWATDAVTWKRLTLTPGLRTEVMKSWAYDRSTGAEIDGALQSVLIPGIGTYVGLTRSFGLLAGVHRGFSPAAAGQPGVRPETSWNYEAGARFSAPFLRIEAIGFLNDYRNLTAVCTFSSGCDDRNIDRQSDAGRARIWGVEAFAQTELRLPGAVTVPLQVAYTFTRTRLLEEFTSDDPQLGHVVPGDELPYVPRHQVHGSLGVEWSRLGLFGEASYVGDSVETAGTGGAEPVPRTFSTPGLNVNASASVRVWGALSFYFQVRNLLDSHAVASRRPFGARPVAPRWIQAGVKETFSARRAGPGPSPARRGSRQPRANNPCGGTMADDGGKKEERRSGGSDPTLAEKLATLDDGEPEDRLELSPDELVEALTGLAELDREAAMAYAVASEALANDQMGHKLSEFRGDHLRHVRDLNALIEHAGGDAVDEDPGDEALLARLAETAAALGSGEILVAMIGNEMLTNGTYRTALDLPCAEEVRAVLARNHRDEQRHLRWLLDARDRLGIEFPAEPPARA